MLNVSAIFLLLLTGIQIGPGVASVSDEATSVSLIDVKRGHVPTFPRVITGRITSAAGKPIAGGVIEWGPVYPPDATCEQVVSAEDGTYRLEIQKAGGHFKLGISAEGYCPTWRKTLIPGPESAPTELNFEMLPETTIEILVVSEAGTPIPNLEVIPMTPTSGFNSSFSSVQQPEPIPGHHKPTRANDQGICTLKQLLPAPEALQVFAENDTLPQQEFKNRSNTEGWISLRIEQDGKRIHEHQISRWEFFKSNGQVRVVIPDWNHPLVRQSWNGTIYGQVSDADGNPITDYQFTVRYKAEIVAVHDADGQFEWGQKLDPNRTMEIRVFAKGFAPSVSNIAPTSDVVPFRIRLVPAPSAKFQLVDQRTKNPVAGVTVVTGTSKRNGWNYVEWNDLGSYADGHHGLENVLRVVSDANGRITVPEGKEQATLIILTPGYGRKIITPEQRPEPDDNGVLQIALEPAATIHATRAPNSRIGREESSIYLELESPGNFSHMFHSLRLNEQGECLIDSLAPGRYQAGLFHSGGNMSTACWLRTIELVPGQHVELPLGEMSGTLTVSGRTAPFTDVSLQPIDDLPGAAKSKLGLTVVATISDIDGYFELNGLDSSAYEVEMGRLSHFDGLFPVSPTFKWPLRLSLKSDTHIDVITGNVAPPESVVKMPAPRKQ